MSFDRQKNLAEGVAFVKEPFNDSDWIFGTKFDGYRTIAVIDSTGKARLWSRNRLPLGLKFGIAEAVISSDQCFVRCRNRRGFCGLSEIPKTCVQMRFRSFSISTLDQIRLPLIGVWALGAVLQQPAGLGVDTDFVCHATILDIEGIA
jgi:hypothetical protein